MPTPTSWGSRGRRFTSCRPDQLRGGVRAIGRRLCVVAPSPPPRPGRRAGWRKNAASRMDCWDFLDALSRRNEISYPLGDIIEPVTRDDANFGGFVVQFRLLSPVAALFLRIWPRVVGVVLPPGDRRSGVRGAVRRGYRGVGAPVAQLAGVQGEEERGGHVGDVHEVADCGALAVDDQLGCSALLDGQELGNEPGRIAASGGPPPRRCCPSSAGCSARSAGPCLPGIRSRLAPSS